MGSNLNPLPPIVKNIEQNEIEDITNYSQEPFLNFSLKDPSVIKYIEDGLVNIEKFSKLLKVGLYYKDLVHAYIMN